MKNSPEQPAPIILKNFGLFNIYRLGFKILNKKGNNWEENTVKSKTFCLLIWSKRKSPNIGIHATNNHENDGAVGVLR